MRYFPVLLAFGLIAAAPSAAREDAAASPPVTAPATEERPPLIPTTAFASRSQFSGAMLSPDGNRIAMRVPSGKLTHLSVLDAATQKPVVRSTLGEDVQLEWFRWAGNDRLLFSLSQVVEYRGGEERFTRLFMLDVTTGLQRYVGPKKQGLTGDDVLWVDEAGRSLLLAYQPSAYKWPSVYRFSLEDAEDGGTKVQDEIDGIWDWYADDVGTVRMGLGWRFRKLRVLYRTGPEDKFREIAKIRPGSDKAEDQLWDVTRIVGGSDEGYVLAENDAGRTVLQRFDYATREPLETLYEHPERDLTSAALDAKGEPLAVYFTDDRDKVVWLDPAIAKTQRQLETALDEDEVWISSRARDNSRMLVWAGGESDPGALYLFHADARKLDPIAEYRPALDPRNLAKPKPVAFDARDGTRISAYLTLPRGRLAKDLPLIILPHGGPYRVRDKLEYRDEVQLLANRGYAVLQPNFRGSSGYGKAFAELGNGQIGRGMQDDLDDAMDWAVKQGFADPARVCVVGSSYGGYAAMWSVIRNPERYRCAASYAGVTDWKRQLRYNSNFLSRKGARGWRDQVTGEEGGFDLDTVSPVKTAAKLQRPVLLAHGKRDTTVPFSQFRAMQKASEDAKAPVQMLVFEDEGHSFSQMENETAWYDALVAFLAKHNPAD